MLYLAGNVVDVGNRRSIDARIHHVAHQWREQPGWNRIETHRRNAVVADPLLAGMAFARVPVHADKTTRALPAVARWEQRKLGIVRAGWNREFLDELSAFPEPEQNDPVAAVTEAFFKTRTTHGNTLCESVMQRETGSMITLEMIDFIDDFEVATLPGIEPG